MQKNTGQLRDRITEAFAKSIGEPEIVRDIAFHMTDWGNDLEEMVKLYEQPQAFSEDEIREIIIGFLVHVPNHVAAAKKLIGLGPIEDIFEVGIFKEDKEQT